MTLEAKFTLARGEEHILGEGGNQCFLETRARFWSICVDALEWNEFLWEDRRGARANINSDREGRKKTTTNEPRLRLGADFAWRQNVRLLEARC